MKLAEGGIAPGPIGRPPSVDPRTTQAMFQNIRELQVNQIPITAKLKKEIVEMCTDKPWDKKSTKNW